MKSMETLAMADDVARREHCPINAPTAPKESKPNPCLLPWDVLLDSAELLTEQAVKHGDAYDEPGFMRLSPGVRKRVYFEKAMRHMMEQAAGGRWVVYDKESGKPVMLHAMTDLCIALSGVDAAKERCDENV